MTDLKAIIFDLGKVVFDLSFERVFHSWAASSGAAYDDIKDKFRFDEVFDRFERNEISAAQFRTAVMDRLGLKLSDENFDKGWCDLYLDIYNDIDQLLIALKCNYRLIALTNTNSIHNPIWREKYAGTLQHFEKIFSSHELGTRKPERQIFEVVLDYLKLKSEKVLFMDDNHENINGAREVGFKTILVTFNAQMMRDIKQYAIFE